MTFTQSFLARDKTFWDYLYNLDSQASFIDSHMNVNNGSTLSITNNTLINMILMSWENCFINVNGGIVLMEENKFQHSNLIQARNTKITWENRSKIKFQHNTITMSTVFFLQDGWIIFSESSLVANNNSLPNRGTVFYNQFSSLIMNASKLLLDNNKCHNLSSLLRAYFGTTRMEMGTLINCTHNKMHSDSVILSFGSQYLQYYHVIFNESSLLVSNNNFETHSSIMNFEVSILNLNAGKWLFEKNKCHTNSYLVQLFYTQMIMENDSLVTFAHNEMDNSTTFYYTKSMWSMSSDSNLQLLDNTASGTFISTNTFFSGGVRVTNNYGIYYGAISFTSSVIWFNGNLEVAGNRGGVSGGFILFESDIFITKKSIIFR